MYDEKAIDEVKSYLASVEKESSHPLAKAVVEFLGDIHIYPVIKTDTVKGGGIISMVNGKKIIAGNASLLKRTYRLNDAQRSDIEALKTGNSVVLTAVDGELKLL